MLISSFLGGVNVLELYLAARRIKHLSARHRILEIPIMLAKGGKDGMRYCQEGQTEYHGSKVENGAIEC